MKKIILLAAVLLSAVGMKAQHEPGSFTLQPKAGINIATITDTENNKWRVGFVGGVEGEYQVTDLFALSAGVLYSQQGFKVKESAGPITVSESWHPGYINIPILANVYVLPGLDVKLGVQPGFMVDKNDAGDAAKTFDFTIPVGLSYEYSNVVLDARYNWGLTKVMDISDDYSPKNSVFQITLGYKFNL